VQRRPRCQAGQAPLCPAENPAETHNPPPGNAAPRPPVAPGPPKPLMRGSPAVRRAQELRCRGALRARRRARHAHPGARGRGGLRATRHAPGVWARRCWRALQAGRQARQPPGPRCWGARRPRRRAGGAKAPWCRAAVRPQGRARAPRRGWTAARLRSCPLWRQPRLQSRAARRPPRLRLGPGAVHAWRSRQGALACSVVRSRACLRRSRSALRWQNCRPHQAQGARPLTPLRCSPGTRLQARGSRQLLAAAGRAPACCRAPVAGPRAAPLQQVRAPCAVQRRL